MDICQVFVLFFFLPWMHQNDCVNTLWRNGNESKGKLLFEIRERSALCCVTIGLCSSQCDNHDRGFGLQAWFGAVLIHQAGKNKVVAFLSVFVLEKVRRHAWNLRPIPTARKRQKQITVCHFSCYKLWYSIFFKLDQEASAKSLHDCRVESMESKTPHNLISWRHPGCIAYIWRMVLIVTYHSGPESVAWLAFFQWFSADLQPLTHRRPPPCPRFVHSHNTAADTPTYISYSQINFRKRASISFSISSSCHLLVASP